MTQVVSSISGLEIYSPSAGYAPTNSGDVSAIASAYQVVSSTATQLYAGTAFLTSVNGAPVSASRAGNAANASMATSAYYDGTGRLISALPDAADVSSIASSYAESAMSSKLDSTAFSTVSGDFLTAETVSSITTSQYGPQPTDVGVTAINGFGLVAKSADTAYSAIWASIAGTDNNLRALTSLADSAAVSSIASSYAESAVSGKADSSSLSSYALSSDVSGVIDTVSSNSASWSGGSLPITGTSGDDSASYDSYHVEFTRYDTAGEPDIRTAELSPDGLWMDYTLDGNDHTSMTLNESMLTFTIPGGDRWVDAYSIDTWNSAVDTVSSNSASWGQGGVDSATVSSIASSYAESAASSKADSSALSSYALSSNVSGVIDTVSANSATWGQGGVVTATGSAWDGVIRVSSVNGSSLWAVRADTAKYDSDGRSITGTYVPKSQYSSVSSCVVANSGAWGANSSLSSPSGTIVVNGDQLEGTNSAVLVESASGFSSVVALNRTTIAYSLNRLYDGTLPGTGALVTLSSTGGALGYNSTFTFSGATEDGTLDSATAEAVAGATTITAQMGSIVSAISASGTNYVYLAPTMTAEKASGLSVTGVGELAWASAVSSKLDSSASSSFYTTANESGYVGSAYVDSAVSGKMDTFSAGEGLEFVQSGSDQLLQVEAPVDIVAGPGIVIDNPDGNTLRVSVAQAQFTELYYNATNTNDTAGKVYQLSEPITNFAYAKITVDNMEFANNPLVYEIDVQHNTTTCNWISPLRNGNLDNTINLPACRLKINSDGNLILDGRSLTYNTYPSPQNTNGASRGFRVVRVVGIFRISGGN